MVRAPGVLALVAVLGTTVWAIRRLQSRAYIKIVVIEGSKSDSKSREFLFSRKDVISIGRRTSNLLILSDTGISGCHCRIWFNKEASSWQVVDLGSLNGTTVNRRVLTVSENSHSDPHNLKSGDKIVVGERTVLKIVCQPSEGPKTRQGKKRGQRSSANGVPQGLPEQLISQQETDPLPPAILHTLNTFQYPDLRLEGCSIQKTGTRGRHDSGCEDTFSHISPFPSQGSCALCLCDGHCGRRTSDHVQQLLPDSLRDKLQHCAEPGGLAGAPESAIQSSMKEVFQQIDLAVDGEDGCTMTTVLFGRGEGDAVSLVAANVGDSAVVCVDFKRMMKIILTDEHRVQSPAENQRLRASGSALTHNGTRLMGLNLSRSIGDKALKELHVGFLAEPYVSKVYTVQPEDSQLLLMASDGLWDVTTTTVVVQIAYGVLKKHPGDLRLLCRVLMDHAIRKRSKDDITIVAVLVKEQQAT